MKQQLLLTAHRRLTRLAAALLGLVATTTRTAQAQRFGPATACGVGGYSPYAVATGDVNGDGRPDIVTVSSTPPATAMGSLVGVLLAQATGFAPVVNYPTGVNVASFSLTLGDVTGDGQLDIVVANASTDNVSVLLGTGAGTFGPPATYSTGVGSRPGGVALGDLNGDGKLDIVTANARSAQNVVEGFAAVLLGSGTGTFGPPALYSTGAGTSAGKVALADVNQDAVPDIILSETNTAAGVRVLLSQAGGGYAAAVGYPAAGSLRSATAVAVGDVNQDGYPDIVATGGANYEVGLLLGRAGGTFGGFTTYPSGGNAPNGLALGDVTGDGRLDAVVTNFFSQAVAVLPGTSAGTFGPAVLFPTVNSTGAYGVALADFNLDGRLDVAEANLYTNMVNVLLNQGPGLTAISPAAAPAGATLTLTGTNLTGATAITFGGTGGTVVATGFAVSADGTAITGVVVPAGATSGNVTVTTPGGTSNGVAFTVAQAPTVATNPVTSITNASAIFSGAVSSNGGSSPTEKGFVYAPGTGLPTTADTKVAVAATTTSFTAVVRSLAPGTTYTVRAYATNGAGPGYGNALTFTTLPDAPVVTTPANGALLNTRTPTYGGTAPAGSTVLVYVDNSLIGAVAATGGTFSLPQPTGQPLADGPGHFVRATATVNGATSAVGNAVSFSIDATAPTATVSTTAGSSTSTAPIPFTVTFSESVVSFSASALSVTGGAVTGGTVSGSGAAYAFSVTPTAGGVVTVRVLAGGAQDAAGNGSEASDPLSIAYAPGAAASLSVRYQTGDPGQPTDNQVRPFLQLTNAGPTAVPYQQLTVRYWLTVENFAGQLVTPIDWAQLGTSYVSARYVALAAPRQGAYGYIEYSFTAGAGSLAPGTDSGPIYGKAYQPTYANFDETDDWSYQPSGSFAPTSRLTLYQNGTLLSGTEPPAVATQTALQVVAASRDATPSPSYLSVQLQVANTGNVPLNYADVQARYYFTRDGATAVVPEVDYAKLGAGNVRVRIVNLPSPVTGADTYAELTFAANLGTFYPRSTTEDILFKLRKDDYRAFDQTNDYSFSSSVALAVQQRIPAYVSTALVFGTPPSGTPARPAATSPASPAAAVVAGPLAVSLTGSPNPFTDQLQLEFSLAHTQAYALAVYDGQGRLVRQLPGGTAPAGQPQQAMLAAHELAAGLYLVRLTTATDRQQLKFIKQ